MNKNAFYHIKGMQRDLSVDKFNPEYAFENMNLRILPSDNNSLLSLVNEKGNIKLPIEGIDNIDGTPIGTSIVDNELVVFTVGNSFTTISDINANSISIDNINALNDTINIDAKDNDFIYKLWFDNDILKGKELFSGKLNFDYNYPLETLSIYENENLKKVFWVDGKNQPRFINISSKDTTKWDSFSFDFTPKLDLKEVVNITKSENPSGIFPSGVIQYSFTYFNKYAQESNIFYTSPLYYTSFNNRGGNPEDKVNNSFNISIYDVDTSFDYLRVYSIFRTSLDATPTVKRVIDIKIPNSNYSYTTSSYSKHTTLSNVYVLKRNPLQGTKLESIIPNESTDNYKLWVLNGRDIFGISYVDSSTTINLDENTNVTVKYTNRYLEIYTDLSNSFIVDEYDKKRILFTDTGNLGEIVDPTSLLYKGGEELIANTITQKDNTLFLGNIEVKRLPISTKIKNYFKGKTIEFTSELLKGKNTLPASNKGYYPYKSQLSKSSHKIKTFKYLETYRLGIQFQHYTGKWSEPIWINDVRNTSPINTIIGLKTTILPIAKFNLDNVDIKKELISQGYIKARPVVVYPELSDRECICQGILCPTIYNVGDRNSNSPFAQSSWFTRPNLPYDIDKTGNNDFEDRGMGIPYNSYNSKSGILLNGDKVVNNDLYINNINRGNWLEFRHNNPIPTNKDRRAEIQCIYNPPSRPYINTNNNSVEEWVAKNNENFYIDQSIFTLHSPDIEFNDSIKNLDTSNLKLRIVGIVPLTSFVGDINIQSSTPPLTDSADLTYDVTTGFYKENIGVENISRFGGRTLASGAFWIDTLSNPKSNTTVYGHVIYPFHRNGSLNNTVKAKDNYKSALLDKKKMSNLRYSLNTIYFVPNKIWNAYIPSDNNYTGISGAILFDSKEMSLIKIPSPLNSGLQDINYYGNIDKIVNPNKSKNPKGYPLCITEYIVSPQDEDTDTPTNYKLFKSDIKEITQSLSTDTHSLDPVRIKYKSTPHIVIALNYTNDSKVRVLPTLKDGDKAGITLWDINPATENITLGQSLFWDKNGNVSSIYQDVISYPFGSINSAKGYGPEYSWLWIAELYNDNIINRFGGNTEDALENNLWLPCGESISLLEGNSTLKWVEGDTYYQRYDHLKTYPFTLEDQNSIVDIVSFMCETRVNLDGRYDRNRGQINNLSINPTNFNLLNTVYSQSNNFYNYRYLSDKMDYLNNFNSSIIWSKTKTLGELVDTWSSINMSSILDLDGNRGDLTALRRLNNDIIAFQEKSISQILYNENYQISTTKGVPIEIANSGKVQGKRYIFDNIGCYNKHSICSTPNGLYFIDDYNKDIYRIGNGIDNISDRLGFHSWVYNNSNFNKWNPKTMPTFKTFYDYNTGDVLFINSNTCLAYSEVLGQFTSFYSYNGIPYLFKILDKTLCLYSKNSNYNIWELYKGDYNMFFDEYKPFYTTIICNADKTRDKIFNTLEFRSDSWNNNNLVDETFDKIIVWNEYQRGEDILNYTKTPSNLKRKFRIWRANIPRQSNTRNRIRNTWSYIKLSKENSNINKTILHDIMIHYLVQ